MTDFVFFQIIPEEVFASNGAIWWSTTGKFLAYVEFNDTEVQKVEFTWYGAEQYPHTVAVPYPKVLSAFSQTIKTAQIVDVSGCILCRSMNWCDLDSCSLPLQAGSPMTKVKLLVVDTADPSRHMQIAPPASVASGYVRISLRSIWSASNR